MTDQPDPSAVPEAAEPTPGDSRDGKPLSLLSNKALWASVGIGSAAIIAAVMYARRPKKSRRDI